MFFLLPSLFERYPTDDDYYQDYALLVGGITLLSGISTYHGQLKLFFVHFVGMFYDCTCTEEAFLKAFYHYFDS